MFSLVFGTGLYTLPVALVTISTIMESLFILFYFSSKPIFVVCFSYVKMCFEIHNGRTRHKRGECSWGRWHLSYSTEHHRSTSQWELSLKNPITQWPHHIFHSLPPSLTRHWGIVILLNDTLQVLVFTFFLYTFLFSFYESALYSDMHFAAYTTVNDKV